MSIETRLNTLISTGVITTTNDAGPLTRSQLRLSNVELKDNVPIFGIFGFTSHPPTGTSALVLSVAGNRSNSYVVGTHSGEFRSRNLAAGDTAIFNAHGMKFTLAGDGGVTVEAAGKPVTINGASNVIINNSNVTVNGGDVIADGISLKNHKHTGVQAGGALTGTPTS